MADLSLPVQDSAVATLMANTVPSPDDLLSGVDPVAAMWFCENALSFTLGHFTASIMADDSGELTGESGPGRALEILAEVLGMFDEACVELGLLPPGMVGK